VIILALGRVPSIDATGLVALESALHRLKHSKMIVVIAGPLPEPRQIFDKANLPKNHPHVYFAPTLSAAIARARDLLRELLEKAPETSRPRASLFPLSSRPPTVRPPPAR
jgi:sulfate permease, SulP family